MKKFVRVKTVVWSDLEVETDNLPSSDDEAVKDHVGEWELDELVERATYFEHEVTLVSDTELEPEEH